MSAAELPKYLALLQQARREWRGRVEILIGLEVDYYPGCEAWVQKLLRQTPLDYVLGSVHPQIREYEARFFEEHPLAVQRQYFRFLAAAAESGLFDCLSHPDLVKNMFPDDWSLALILPEVMSALDRIAAAGVALELNTSGTSKAIPEFNPSQEILTAARMRNIPIVVGSDAHEPERVADQFCEAFGKLREVGYQEISFFRRRQRENVAIQTAVESMRTLPR